MPKPARVPRIPWRSLATAATAALLAALLAPAAAHGGARARADPSTRTTTRSANPSGWTPGSTATATGRPTASPSTSSGPREPAQQGRKIPVIMDASPYYSCCGRGNESQQKTYDANGERRPVPAATTTTTSCRAATPSSRVDLAGTNRSDGCVDVGGRSDIQSAKAVVDWLNGRGHGLHHPHRRHDRARRRLDQRQHRHDRQELGRHHRQRRRRHRRRGPEDHRPDRRHLLLVRLLLRQGRPALRLAAPTGCPTTSRAPTPAPALRRRPAEARRRGPAHRRLDPAVDRARLRAGRRARSRPASSSSTACRTSTSAPSTSASGGTPSPKNGVERKIWLSQTGHVDPFDFRRADWVDTLHRWFDHELLGYDNGIDREPMADIERAPRPVGPPRPVWPPRGTDATTLRPRRGQRRPASAPSACASRHRRTETFTDDPQLSETDWAAQIDRSTPAKAGLHHRAARPATCACPAPPR